MKTNYTFYLLTLFVFFSCNNKQQPQLFSYTDSLKLRDSSSVNSNVIGYLQKSSPVIYLGEKKDSLIALIEGNLIFGQWLKVKTNSGTVGWVFSGGIDFDASEEGYGKFNSSNMATDSILVVPNKKNIPVYKLPHLSSEKTYSIKGYSEVMIKGEDTVVCPVTNLKRIWIRYENDKGNTAYILKSNLARKSIKENPFEELKNALIKKYGVKKTEEGYEFKSIKKFINGDDGADWTEESELVFDFGKKYITIGYMYTYDRISMKQIEKNGNKYIFWENSAYSMDKKFEIELDNGFIKVNNAGELSVKYIPGRALNY